jgi:4-carboxymuconolactone decarboxylase
MDDRTRALLDLSSSLARGIRGEWPDMLRRASRAALAVEIEECILQSYLFLGYPTVLQALTAWRDITPEAVSVEGVTTLKKWHERGEQVCATVYGGQYQRLRENVLRLHPDLEDWMLTEGYGKVLARPGLDLKTRELCIVALLSAQDSPHQLYSHLRGALNAGATPGEVDEAVMVLAGALPRERAQQTRAVWNEVKAKRTAGEEE